MPQQLQLAPIDALKPYPRNARTHSPSQIEQIAKSIKRFGFTNPVLVDAQMQIIAGHGRVEAAKLAGLTHVSVVRIENMSETVVKSVLLAKRNDFTVRDAPSGICNGAACSVFRGAALFGGGSSSC